MPIVIHHGPAGTRGARPIWACEELGIPYEIIDVGDLAASAEYRKSPEYRKLNPVGKVPAMTDGDLKMFESVAMMQYILDRYGGGQLQPAPGTACAHQTPHRRPSQPAPLLPSSPAWGGGGVAQAPSAARPTAAVVKRIVMFEPRLMAGDPPR